jgi:hypothetical protein
MCGVLFHGGFGVLPASASVVCFLSVVSVRCWWFVSVWFGVAIHGVVVVTNLVRGFWDLGGRGDVVVVEAVCDGFSLILIL